MKEPSAREVMIRFLNDCYHPDLGRVEINQPIQARTFARAIKEGYILHHESGGGELTERGLMLLGYEKE